MWLEQLFYLGDRRLDRPRRSVPQYNQRARWPQHASDFSECALVVEPVARFGDEDSIDRRVGERDLFSRPRKEVGLRTARDEPLPHLWIGFERNDVCEFVDEQTRQLAG